MTTIDDPDADRLAVLRQCLLGGAEPTGPGQLPASARRQPAPEWMRGSAVGMCRFPGQPAPYDESADEIGSTKHYDDYLES